MELSGAICVDCFAGSGALGFEAASRGAGKVYLLEQDSRVAEALAASRRQLQAEQVVIRRQRAEHVLESERIRADIFFLDPPFDDDLIRPTLDIILARDLLTEAGLVYLEYPAREVPQLDPGLTWYRQKQAADVGFGLIRKTSDV